MNEATRNEKPRRPLRKKILRFSLSSLLLLATMLGVVGAIESNRIHVQNRIEQCVNSTRPKPFGDIEFLTDVRFRVLDDSRFDWLTKYLGKHWNQDITSIVIRNDQSGGDVIKYVCRLRKLRILHFSGYQPSESELLQLSKMKHLQWLHVPSGKRYDKKFIEALRKKMPQTFVTF